MRNLCNLLEERTVNTKMLEMNWKWGIENVKSLICNSLLSMKLLNLKKENYKLKLKEREIKNSMKIRKLNMMKMKEMMAQTNME